MSENGNGDKQKNGCLPVIILVVLVAAVVGVLSGDDDEPRRATTSGSTASTSSSSASGQDDDSRLACSHFRNVMRDTADGVLTDAEIREKVREVEDDAIIATSAIQTGARRLLAAATTGTTEEFVEAALDLSSACEDAGW